MANKQLSENEVLAASAGTNAPVFIIRPSTPGGVGNVRPMNANNRVITIGSSDAGNVVLRGNQLVRLPRLSGPNVGMQATESPSMAKSPVKLLFASNLAKPTAPVNVSRSQTLLLSGTANHSIIIDKTSDSGAERSPLVIQQKSAPTGPAAMLLKGAVTNVQQSTAVDTKPKVQQYRVLLPAGQTAHQVVVVNSSGVPNVGANTTATAAAAAAGISARSTMSDGQTGHGILTSSNAGYYNVSAMEESGEIVPMTAATTTLHSYGMETVGGNKRLSKNRSFGLPGSRKPCNCTKSQCLKLYCDCFANGEFCRSCNCTTCHNNLAYESERSKAVKSCLERNPFAFQPKIGKGRADTDRLHNKGCNCKKSNCLKNYCECYEAKVACTRRCKCHGCRNTESDRSHRHRVVGGLHSLAKVASGLHASIAHSGDYQYKADSPVTEPCSEKSDPKKMPWYYMTDDVVEATALCLVAKAEQIESKESHTESDLQREVLKEYGRCLKQIICSATA